MLNHIHNHHLHNTDGDGQAMGEELRFGKSDMGNMKILFFPAFSLLWL